MKNSRTLTIYPKIKCWGIDKSLVLTINENSIGITTNEVQGSTNLVLLKIRISYT